MPGFINGTTNVTLAMIERIVNSTSPADFAVKANQIIYGGIFYFVLLCVFCIILFLVTNHVRDQPLNNAMYVMALGAVLSFIMRVICTPIDGIKYCLLTDHLMWVFPIGTALLAAIIWGTKDR